jgi:hypothetical protein
MAAPFVLLLPMKLPPAWPACKPGLAACALRFAWVSVRTGGSLALTGIADGNPGESPSDAGRLPHAKGETGILHKQ